MKDLILIQDDCKNTYLIPLAEIKYVFKHDDGMIGGCTIYFHNLCLSNCKCYETGHHSICPRGGWAEILGQAI